MEKEKQREIPTFVILLFCMGAMTYLILIWNVLALLSLLILGFYVTFRGDTVTWKESLTVFGLIVYVGLIVTPITKVWQLYRPKKPHEIVLQPPFDNLDREQRLFTSTLSKATPWMSTRPTPPNKVLGMKHSAALGLRGRVYEGAYPTQAEAEKLIKHGALATADDLVALSHQVDIRPNTLFQLLYGNEADPPFSDPAYNVDWRRYVIVGHPPQSFAKKTLNYIDPRLKRAVKWAKCGELCRAVAPMVQYNGVWRNNGGHIFLVEVWNGIVFARYDTNDDNPMFVYTE